MIATVIVGAGGRMGQALIALMPEFPQLALHAAIDAAGSKAIGQTVGNVTIAANLAQALSGAGLMIDFSHASASAANLAAATDAGVPTLLGTTGIGAEVQGAIAQAAARIPVLQSANTSIGVALMAELVQRAAAALGSEYNIEIIEAHHKHKLDAPSGTALLLGEAAAQGRNTTLAAASARQPRGANGARRDTEIGMASIRGGDVVGEHEVQFLGPGERLVIRHSATDRALFARGALRAGQWLAGQGPGRYRMSDVFL
jgi:4-hydroxy-tetrahydrodipicolinate reductase